MNVPLLDLNAQYTDEIIKEIETEIAKVVSRHNYILGSKVKEFEEQMQEYLNVKYCIGCASGTDALILALQASGIGKGDEVITTPFTFFATASSIYRLGAKPVFADIREDTFNIDPGEIEKFINDKTRAIVPVHLFGQAAEMDTICRIAREHNLAIVEDNAQGIGAKYKEKFAGTFGDVGTLSFFPSKNLGAMGDAGMCMTNSESLAGKIKQLRVHGENPKYIHKWVGLNSRLDTIQAAVLSVKLKHLSKWSEQRRQNAEFYDEAMKDIEQVKTPFVSKNAVSIYNQYTLVVEKRDELMDYLKGQGVGCNVYYPLPLHLQDCFAEFGGKIGDCPVSEKLAGKVLSLPIYSELTRDMQLYVVEKVKEFYK